jgi:hypothetical protein
MDHNNFFVRWWCEQLEQQGDKLDWAERKIVCAVLARFIMNTDLSRINHKAPLRLLTYTIYHPGLARVVAYKELARRRLEMTEQVTGACIIGITKQDPPKHPPRMRSRS